MDELKAFKFKVEALARGFAVLLNEFLSDNETLGIPAQNREGMKFKPTGATSDFLSRLPVESKSQTYRETAAGSVKRVTCESRLNEVYVDFRFIGKSGHGYFTNEKLRKLLKAGNPDFLVDEPRGRIKVKGKRPMRMKDFLDQGNAAAMTWCALCNIGKWLKNETTAKMLGYSELDSGQRDDRIHHIRSALRTLFGELSERIFVSARNQAYLIGGNSFTYCWVRLNPDRFQSQLIQPFVARPSEHQ